MKMKKLFGVAAGLGFLWVAVALGASETPRAFVADPAHSSVSFKIRHLVGKVRGQFNDFTCTITGDPESPEKASVELAIKAASIDTGNDKRDAHLRSPDFFNAEKFPIIAFKSSAISRSGEAEYAVTGEFTMHGVTRTIVVPVTLNGVATDPWGNLRAGFEIAVPLDRKEYGIVWNKTLDQGGLMLGDEVTVMIELEMIRKK